MPRPLLFLDVDGPLLPFGEPTRDAADAGDGANGDNSGNRADGAKPPANGGNRADGGKLLANGGTRAGGDNPLANGGTRAGGDNPLLHRLDPALGPRLLALDCVLVWATTWSDEANTTIAPLLGLPPLPVIDFPEATAPVPRGVHWKTHSLSEWAGHRPFIWLDDEITETDRTWTTAAHPAPTLLLRVDPARGVTEEDFATMGEWLRLHGCR
ncbi:HAD domain-containing protein [Streptomyces sp. NPDC052012]|uniref:HAD domain-containing protein n=1 Tax=Streptomyces sp. NPDC052012 TaxID=3155051 RepID=UPI00344F1A02